MSLTRRARRQSVACAIKRQHQSLYQVAGGSNHSSRGCTTARPGPTGPPSPEGRYEVQPGHGGHRRKPRRAGRAGRTKHLEGGRRLAGAGFARWHAREEAARHHDLRSRSRPSAPGSADIHTRTFHMPGSSDRPGPESGPRAGVADGARAPLCAYSRRRTWRRAHQG